MPPIRRAAVTGLFALWLAPLPQLDGSQPASATIERGTASAHVEAVATDERARLRGWAAERRASPAPSDPGDESAD